MRTYCLLKGVGALRRWLSLVSKHQNLNSDPLHPHKGWAQCVCNLRAGGALETGGSLEPLNNEPGAPN